MKMQRKYILVLLSVFLLNNVARSQETSKHELSVYGGYIALSALKYKTTIGSNTNGMGGVLGLGYNYSFTNNWSLNTGAELSLYNAKAKLDNLSDKYMSVDFNGEAFQFSTSVSNYSEKQNAVFMNIPLMIQYQTNGNNKFYASAGAKIGIPLTAKYKTSGATIKNSGRYNEFEPEFTTQKFLGFGEFDDKNMNADLDFKIAYMASAEIGIKWKLGNSTGLYTGAYLDYGLNDIGKDKRTKQFVEYNTDNPEQFITNSVLTSQYSQNGKIESFTDKVSLMAVGVKIRFAFGLVNSEKSKSLRTYTPPSQPPSSDVTEAENRAKLAQQEELARKKEKEEEEAERVAESFAENIKKMEADKKEAKTEIEKPMVQYTVNQTELSPQQKSGLETKIELLEKYPNLHIICEGYTCDLGSNLVNENIGLKRAEAAKAYLIEKGISANRISAISKGKQNPIAPNNNEQNRQKNRRVEFIIK